VSWKSYLIVILVIQIEVWIVILDLVDCPSILIA
jgi:hypothetical protein